LLELLEFRSFCASLELGLVVVVLSRSVRRASRSLEDEELDLRSRVFRERFRRLRSDEEDEELLSLDRERDLERVSRRLWRFTDF
jgi:hypothetical protein